MYKYQLSNRAKEDLLRIYEFGVYRFGVAQADRYFNLIHDCFDKIESYPFMFVKVDFIKSDYYKCICGVETIYYKIKDRTIEIIRIIGRQDFRASSLT